MIGLNCMKLSFHTTHRNMASSDTVIEFISIHLVIGSNDFILFIFMCNLYHRIHFHILIWAYFYVTATYSIQHFLSFSISLFTLSIHSYSVHHIQIVLVFLFSSSIIAAINNRFLLHQVDLNNLTRYHSFH